MSPYPTKESLRATLIMKFVSDLDDAAKAVQSPIEELMLWALMTAYDEDWGQRWWASCDVGSSHGLPGGIAEYDEQGLSVFAVGAEATGREISITLQPEITVGEHHYRIDLALAVRHFTHRIPTRVLPPGQNYYHEQEFIQLHSETYVAIECDGHDFHEKTKEQAARDKQRDRDLQSIGWAVARFTGSEIFKNAPAAAEQVRRMVWGIERSRRR